MKSLLGKGDVLVSAVGPFSKFGAPVIRAAIDREAHYLDTTGAGQSRRRGSPSA